MNLAQRLVRNAWVDELERRMFDPLYFVSLTFRYDVAPEEAEQLLRYLIRELNEAALGSNYHKKVKHSYFGYVFVIENIEGGGIHLHGLIDNEFDIDLLKRYWHREAGWAEVEKVIEPLSIIRYIFKQSSDPIYWFPNKQWELETRKEVSLA